MHPLLKEFLEYRKTLKRRSKRSRKNSFCGSPKNKGKKKMGSPQECLKRGYGMSNYTFIKDLDKFFKMKETK
jgi:hypothetical protein